MNGLVNNILGSLVGSVLFSIIVLWLFDVRELRRRLFKYVGIRPSHTFDKITSREQVVRGFNDLFVKYEVNKGGSYLPHVQFGRLSRIRSVQPNLGVGSSPEH